VLNASADGTLSQSRSAWQFPNPAASYDERPPVVPLATETTVTLSAPAGAIYYTTDGSGPRLPGGAGSPTAFALVPAAMSLAQDGSELVLLEDQRMTARALFNGQWSALSEATFYVFVPLGITAVLFNPRAQAPAELLAAEGTGFDDDDHELVAVMNSSGSRSVNLASFTFGASINFAFAGGTLAPGERAGLG